jgi:hypothetical protein
MSVIGIPTIHNPAEFVISLIRQNCNNPDDLSKIALVVECLLEEIQEKKEHPTLKQLLTQITE